MSQWGWHVHMSSHERQAISQLDCDDWYSSYTVLEEAIVRLEAMFSVEVLSVEVDGVSICVSLSPV